MTFPDDIPNETPVGETERAPKPNEKASRRSVGPESEQRGGPKVVDETLDDKEAKSSGPAQDANITGDT